VVGALVALGVGACSLATVGELGPPGSSAEGGADRRAPPPLDATGGSDVRDGRGPPPRDVATDETATDHGGTDAKCTPDAATDPLNCGSCGHDCLGGACAGGMCQPVVLATPTSPLWLAIQSDKILFWTQTNNTVSACGLPACTSTVTAGGCTGTSGIAVDPTHYYFTCRDSYQLYACPNGSGCMGVTPIATQPYPGALTVTPTTIYYLFQSDTAGDLHSGGVASQAPDGGTSNVIRGAQNYPAGIARFGTKLFWTETQENAVSSCTPGSPTDCGDYAQLLIDQTAPDQIFADKMHVYFTNNGTSPDYSDGAVIQANLDGTGYKTLAPARSYPRGIVADATDVYWVDYALGTPGAGSVNRVPIGGGTVTVLASAQWGPVGLAQDAKAIYWGNQPGGQILRLAK
jgi:hypothetical protein